MIPKKEYYKQKGACYGTDNKGRTKLLRNKEIGYIVVEKDVIY